MSGQRQVFLSVEDAEQALDLLREKLSKLTSQFTLLKKTIEDTKYDIENSSGDVTFAAIQISIAKKKLIPMEQQLTRLSGEIIKVTNEVKQAEIDWSQAEEREVLKHKTNAAKTYVESISQALNSETYDRIREMADRAKNARVTEEKAKRDADKIKFDRIFAEQERATKGKEIAVDDKNPVSTLDPKASASNTLFRKNADQKPSLTEKKVETYTQGLQYLLQQIADKKMDGSYKCKATWKSGIKTPKTMERLIHFVHTSLVSLSKEKNPATKKTAEENIMRQFKNLDLLKIKTKNIDFTNNKLPARTKLYQGVIDALDNHGNLSQDELPDPASFYANLNKFFQDFSLGQANKDSPTASISKGRAI